MELKYPELFKPFKIGTVEVKNRIVLTSMTISGWVAPDGNLTDEAITYYVERAKGGAGLIYTHAYMPDSKIEINKLINGPFNNPGYFILQGKKLVEKCHAYGAKVFFVLFLGMGRNIFPGSMDGDPVAPSAVPNRWNPNLMCKEMTKEQIQQNIDATIAAATICKMTGCDGLDINGVYGSYLGDQFAMSAYNKRTDEYGGSSDGQLKMLSEVLKGVKEQCGQDFPVTVRFTVKHYSKGMGLVS